jgi:hypothetical protein
VYETITTGMTVVCRTYFDTVIEGEIIGFDANTKMIIIKPTLALNQQLRKGTHMVNIDYIKNISIMKEELPTDKVLANSEYEGKHDMQDNINMWDVTNTPPQEELPADNEVLTKYEHTHSTNVMTSQRETLDVAKTLAYMDENYNIPSQMRDEDEPTDDLEKKEHNVQENPYNIDETHQEEDVANYKQTYGVANKKESRGSP